MIIKNHHDYQVMFLEETDILMKEKISNEVYIFLEKVYETCGGINTGTGFRDVKDMIDKIPLWRLTFVKDEMVSVMMFKIKSRGIKMVAYGSKSHVNPSIKFSDIQYMLKFSFSELSGALLVFVLKFLGPDWKKFVQIPTKNILEKQTELLTDYVKENLIPKNSKIMYDRLKKDWPELINYCYLRSIGCKIKVKVLMGTFKSHE